MPSALSLLSLLITTSTLFWQVEGERTRQQQQQQQHHFANFPSSKGDCKPRHMKTSATSAPIILPSPTQPVVITSDFELTIEVPALYNRGQMLLMDPRSICKKTRRVRGRLAEICTRERLLEEMARGVLMATAECKMQFRALHWNCTTERKSLRRVLLHDTRETAFVNAITAAGLTYGVTRACTMGNLVECTCDGQPRARKGGRLMRKGDPSAAVTLNASPATALLTSGPKVDEMNVDFQWGGCSDNVHFGYKKSRDFFDALHRKRSDIKTLVKSHNNDAGRLAVKNFMHSECKCHGVSGACTLRTCWRKMPPFREVSARLKERFDGATKVIPSNDGRHFQPGDVTFKPPGRGDLIYTEESPNYCLPDRKTGSLGTRGRECNATSQGTDGCDLLCCGRNYDTHVTKEPVKCQCRFQWCCKVLCKTCCQKRIYYTCR